MKNRYHPPREIKKPMRIGALYLKLQLIVEASKLVTDPAIMEQVKADFANTHAELEKLLDAAQ